MQHTFIVFGSFNYVTRIVDNIIGTFFFLCYFYPTDESVSDGGGGLKVICSQFSLLLITLSSLKSLLDLTIIYLLFYLFIFLWLKSIIHLPQSKFNVIQGVQKMDRQNVEYLSKYLE